MRAGVCSLYGRLKPIIGWFISMRIIYTIIARKARDYVWVMARSATIDAEKYQQLIDFIVSIGYSADKIVRAPHEGVSHDKAPQEVAPHEAAPQEKPLNKTPRCCYLKQRDYSGPRRCLRLTSLIRRLY